MKSSERGIDNSLRSYASRLQSNNLDAHMILYSNNHLFECNPRTKEIRPFNCVKWYQLESKGFDNILYVLEALFNTIYPRIDDESTDIEIGTIVNRTIAIDMDNMINKIRYDGSFMIYFNGYRKSETMLVSFYDIQSKAYKECKELNEFLTDKYDKWNKAMLFLLNNYEDVKDLF